MKGSNNSCKRPGAFFMDYNGCLILTARHTASLPITKTWSYQGVLNMVKNSKLYNLAAISPATAAEFHSSYTPAASALLLTAIRSTLGYEHQATYGIAQTCWWEYPASYPLMWFWILIVMYALFNLSTNTHSDSMKNLVWLIAPSVEFNRTIP